MIDFVKLHWKDKYVLENYIKKRENFDELLMVLEKHSGELRYPYLVEFTGMRVGITKVTGYVKNSLHKAYNIWKTQENHNHNQFTYSQLCKTINYTISRVTDIDNSKITQLEFGLNIPIGNSAEYLITKNILMHKLKGANHTQEYYGTGKLKQFDYYNHKLKIYDKAKQYHLRTHIIRFEIKFVKSIELEKMEIFNIKDLKVKCKLRLLFIFLLKKFNELTIIDNYNKNNTSKEDRRLLRKYTNHLFWEEELKNKSRQTKSRHKKKFEKILVNNNLLKTKNMLRDLIVKEFIFLINH